MLVFRYSKLNGGEFISHLDTLRHIGKTIKRAKMHINYSNGFNHHALIFMSSPIGCGQKSLAEYCFIDSNESSVGFKEKFNDKSNEGIKCIEVYQTDTKVPVASIIESCIYKIEGIPKFDVQEFLKCSEFWVINKKGVKVEVRDRILGLHFEGESLIAHLSFGNITLRPDVLASGLVELYGGEYLDSIKLEARISNGEKIESILKSEFVAEV